MNCGRELLKGNTDSLLLCLINSHLIYGYQIIQELEKKSKGYFKFREGTLYPALHRLEKTGLIKGRWQKLPGIQERRYYCITEKGQEALNRKLAIWRGFSEAVNLIMPPNI
jgi:PadR family transcriptional regulator PadR